MERLRAKLKSESGASITYGLLLFLICAVLSSVILVAGSAAAGRIKNLAEVDQRYYAVTSAAEFVKNLIDAKPVCVVTVVTRAAEDGAADTSKKYVVAKPASEISDSTEFTDTKPNTLLESIVYSIANVSGSETGNSKEVFLTVKNGGTEIKNLAVTVDESWSSDGRISMSLYNSDGDPFRINLDFVPDIETFNYNDYPEDSLMRNGSTYISSITQYTWSMVGMTSGLTMD